MYTPKPGLAFSSGGSCCVVQRTVPCTSTLLPWRSWKTMRTAAPAAGSTFVRRNSPSFEMFLMWPLPRSLPASNAAGMRFITRRRRLRSIPVGVGIQAGLPDALSVPLQERFTTALTQWLRAICARQLACSIAGSNPNACDPCPRSRRT